MELFVPMLADPATEKTADKLLLDDNWWAERKFDGDRLLVHVDGGKVNPVNRNGKPTTIPKSVQNAFARITSGQWAFDGEIIKTKFFIFDLITAGNGTVVPSMPLEERRAVLEAFWPQWSPPESVVLSACARTADEKAVLVQYLKDDCAEGYMLKNIRSTYRSGKRPKDYWRKVKFWKTVDVVVSEVGREGKDNAVMVLLDPDRGIVEVGTTSTIGKGDIKPGDVLEVKFLYVVDRARPRLVQPTILKKRTDKDMAECTLDQLETCYTNKLVEA